MNEQAHGLRHRRIANDELYTPPPILRWARAVMGGIDLDPASSARANRAVMAGRYYTADDDGLRLPWAGRVWCNPPFSRKREFVERLLAHPDQWCALLSADLSSGPCLRLMMGADHCYMVRPEPRFLAPDGRKRSAWFATMVCAANLEADPGPLTPPSWPRLEVVEREALLPL